ncbi:MAG TPA: peptide chain release factor 3 [Ignavibacteriaceae bacterium]|nr:peptide chain release factor 3 [Ignavibacteriaceae bacterium]
MPEILENIRNRKTFAIISHPDAGKTTLTEKILLYSGAIQIAGAVKSNKIRKTATSDFLEIEKQRGISVATSVLSFEYSDKKINLLDTPGHKDFAEDTYRTLTAVDSVILVIDCVKGVEEQTEKLMKVCRMRNTPVIVFINKLDREGRDPIELLDEIEAKLDIHVRPLSYPLGIGYQFRGVYNIFKHSFAFYQTNKQRIEEDVKLFNGLSDPELDKSFGSDAEKLRRDVNLVEGIYGEFDIQNYLSGQVAPVFFGSALNNFGVKELLETFIEIAPNPLPREATNGFIEPSSEKFSGFIFKIHANLDPKHRDRIAFLRVCSGKFERNKYYHHVRLKRDIKFPNPASFMAQSKSLVDDAYPGDVIGLYDSGIFKIGDTLTEGDTFMYKGIPAFSPEVFRIVRNTDPFKSKQLEKGIQYLTDEGLAQLFTQNLGNKKVIGVVGELQFDVLKYRLLHEYGASVDFLGMPSYKAFWVLFETESDIEDLKRLRYNSLYEDKNGHLVFIAESEYTYHMAVEKNPKARFLSAIEHNDFTVNL